MKFSNNIYMLRLPWMVFLLVVCSVYFFIHKKSPAKPGYVKNVFNKN